MLSLTAWVVGDEAVWVAICIFFVFFCVVFLFFCVFCLFNFVLLFCATFLLTFVGSKVILYSNIHDMAEMQ